MDVDFPFVSDGGPMVFRESQRGMFTLLLHYSLLSLLFSSLFLVVRERCSCVYIRLVILTSGTRTLGQRGSI